MRVKPATDEHGIEVRVAIVIHNLILSCRQQRPDSVPTGRHGVAFR
jgi:hypothetical protein